MRCAFYEREITPPLGCEIPGYYEIRVSDGVLDRLYAKAFAADDGEHQAVFLALDSVEVSASMREGITARLGTLAGLSPESVAICATHTHLGIPVGEPVGSKEDPEYIEQLIKLAADTAVMALHRLVPCTLSFGTGLVEGISFNRNYLMQDGSVCTNPVRRRKFVVRPFSGVNPALPVLLVRNAAGAPLGALYSYACHQDCIGGTKFSGDYSSVVAKQLKNHYGSEFVSIYMAGPSGDINHLDPKKPQMEEDHYQFMGKRLADEAIRVMEEACSTVTGEQVGSALSYIPCKKRKATAEELANAQADVNDPVISKTFDGTMSELLLHYAEYSPEDSILLPIQVLAVGDAAIIALPGEVYHEFGERVVQGCPQGKCLVAALANGVFGYIPVPELFGTNIYEAKLCEGSFLEAEAGGLIVEEAARLAKKLLTKRE